MQSHLGRPLAILGDIASVSIIGGAIAGYLPAIASLLAIAWYAVQLWESRTGRELREWLKRRGH